LFFMYQGVWVKEDIRPSGSTARPKLLLLRYALMKIFKSLNRFDLHIIGPWKGKSI